MPLSPANSKLLLYSIFGLGGWPVGWTIRWTHPNRPKSIIGHYREKDVVFHEADHSWIAERDPQREYDDFARRWTPEVLEP